MAATDELLGLAEIAVALIGFAGLIFLFRARDVGEVDPRDLSTAAVIIGGGSLALAFSLLPVPLAHLGLSEVAYWRTCCGGLGLALLGASALFWIVNARLIRAGSQERVPALNRVTGASTSVTSLLLIASALGVVPAGPAVYLFALVVCLLIALAFVAFILVVARDGS